MPPNLLSPKSDAPSKDTSRSIRRAIALLREVAQTNPRRATLSNLALKANLHPATAHRILNVLAGEGLISYDPVSRLYSLGIELYSLGSTAHQYHIRNIYHSTLERISQMTEDSVYLLIRNGYDGLCIDYVEGRTPIRIMNYRVGSQTPLGMGSGGLALLSFLSPDQVEAILAANEKRYQALHGLAKEDVRAAVDLTRANGFSISEGLYIKGVVGVGLPIHRRQEIVASVSVAAIADRMPPARRLDIVQLLKRELALVSESLDDPAEAS